MQVNYNCLKDILSVFSHSVQAELSIIEVAKNTVLKKYDEETLKFHIQRLYDSQWICSRSRFGPLLSTDVGSSWNDCDWRWTGDAETFFSCADTPDVWGKFLKVAKNEPLEAAIQIMKGLRKKHIDVLLNDN